MNDSDDRRAALIGIGAAIAGTWAGGAAAASSAADDRRRLADLEEIRTLRARRDYLLDTRDWKAYAALHAPDHVSVSVTTDPLVGGAALVGTVSKKLEGRTNIHHSYSPIIDFETPDLATGIWAMNYQTFWKDGGRQHSTKTLGYYHER
jgi:hypothetical protein